MFSYIKENLFGIICALSISFIIIVGLYQIFSKKEGSYSKNYFFDTGLGKKKNSYVENNSNSINKVGESKGEIECRRVLQKIFNRPFNKERPSFLNNSVTGGSYNLELDCFDRDLGLAVEYNGRQHMEYIPFFHKNKEAFYNQKYRDELKRRMCKDNGIILIEVPYTVKNENIESFLINELKKKGF
jgi:hypothetical protein